MKDMSTKEILAEYNKLTGKGITKFTDRKSAERRLKNARILHANGKAVKKPKPINKAQHTRHRVTVQKGRAKPKEYRSVKQAFEELGLSAHVKFRMELKAKGSHEIQGYKFKLVK